MRETSLSRKKLLEWECIRRNPRYKKFYNKHKNGKFSKYLLDPNISSVELYRTILKFHKLLSSFFKKLKNVHSDLSKFLEAGQELRRIRKQKNISKAYINKLRKNFHRTGRKLLGYNESYELDLTPISKISSLWHLGSKYPQDFPIAKPSEKYFWYFEGKKGAKKLKFFEGDAVIKNNFLRNRIAFDNRNSGKQLDELKEVKKKEDILKLLPRRISIKINLDYDKNIIMSEIKQELDRWFELFKYFNLKKDKRMPDYKIIERYLTTYDMRNKKPQPTFSQIAEKVYSAVANRNLQSAIQQVKREYKKAEKIILGGYKDLKVTF